MEVKLDDVQEGNESRIKNLTDFYNPFEERIKELTKKCTHRTRKDGENCPLADPLSFKKGKNGKFIGCPISNLRY